MRRLDGLPLEIKASEAVHALTHLARLSADEKDRPSALTALGDRSGETWQHLYGLTLDSDHTLPGLVDVIESMDAVEFRRVLLGTTAWSWVNLLGTETLEDAVHGDEEAAEKLLSHERYYSGKSEEALQRVVSWNPAETKQRYLESLVWYATEYGDELPAVRSELAHMEERVSNGLDREGVSEGVAELTGYRYLAEPEAERVVLLIHAVDESLCLAQHRQARLIVHGIPLGPDPEEDITRLGGALADSNRVQLLRQIARGPTDLAPLLDASGLARSTVHHHLAVLRKAGLVEVEGNAGSYRYRIREGAGTTLLEAWKRLIDTQTRGDK